MFIVYIVFLNLFFVLSILDQRVRVVIYDLRSWLEANDLSTVIPEGTYAHRPSVMYNLMSLDSSSMEHSTRSNSIVYNGRNGAGYMMPIGTMMVDQSNTHQESSRSYTGDNESMYYGDGSDQNAWMVNTAHRSSSNNIGAPPLFIVWDKMLDRCTHIDWYRILQTFHCSNAPMEWGRRRQFHPPMDLGCFLVEGHHRTFPSLVREFQSN